KFDVYDLTYLPAEYTTVAEEDQASFDKLMNMLEECEDVQDVFHNVQL
ncbi:MAG: YebC/PmpR family DNA-binding transcriptional regulator, partial [Erysipelothrix sp.]|nr:YebC/PmpR family DNA-binding transcriptional regulator [Erysipelothrix sp.]